ncbi:type III pantothenate kinase [uncultured Prevotella sp.]|uniref:type III pantothenate kinase n=1 Tax=uncultured Prevotella sp. TaxID=159272 RepID=UPI002639DDBC|nr:type III pantothenate kinase [uncultured Prevotella sp.]
MNLIIDIGNTCVKLVCFNEGKVVEEQRTDKDDAVALQSFCSRYPFSRGICSSVSDISEEYSAALSSLPFSMMEFKSGVTRVPIINKYNTPLTLGSDRLAAVVGANWLQPGRDVLVIDIGTCVTFDFINSIGEYLGGNISPGPTMRLKALNHFTARLPFVERRGDTPDFGTDTTTAIRSGVMNGIKYEIEGYIHSFLAKYPQLFVYLTGGVHLNLQFSENLSIFADDFIVPKGLNRILEYNNEHK